ncbi:hypothetical protein [Streptomyces sp. CB02400]|uniref:hypothetical protein n=1 Tax=Streptomyces sp. CB02400 TaxID=1703944 RepID=UPI00093CC11F
MTENERAFTRTTCLSARHWHHDRLTALAGVPLDRAGVALLHRLADGEPAAQLGVEASTARSCSTRSRRRPSASPRPGPAASATGHRRLGPAVRTMPRAFQGPVFSGVQFYLAPREG